VSPERLTCVIVDDHPCVLDAIGRLLAAHGIDVAATVESAADALAAIREHRPAVALVDLQLGGIGGLEVCRTARASCESTNVVVYTGHADVARAADALEAGALGFVSKDAPLSDLVDAVRSVAAGEPYIDPTLAHALLERMGDRRTDLTPTEREMIQLLAEGLTIQQIGLRSGISRTATHARTRSAMRKLGADTQAQAVAAALRDGWIS
jgi:DNA-binding NarL/FixJ family response regulator